jgi:hypothetical protein
MLILKEILGTSVLAKSLLGMGEGNKTTNNKQQTTNKKQKTKQPKNKKTQK